MITFLFGAAFRSSIPKQRWRFAIPPSIIVNRYHTALPSSSTSSPNEVLVQKRLQSQRIKKSVRKQYSERDRERNLQLKRLLHTTADGYPIPELYAVKVSVCPLLRSELKLNGREKRGRVFIEIGSDGSMTLKGLKCELHSFFRCLKKSTFVLEAALPIVSDDGSIKSPSDIELSNYTFWPVDSDTAVQTTFLQARDHFDGHSHLVKRPTILLHVSKDPNAPPPPPPPTYLDGMLDPNETTSMTMISFYSFPPRNIDNPEEFATQLKKSWKPFGVLGRVYVAEEGVNAQMAIPTNVLDNFVECCESIPELGRNMENGINIDPIPLSMEEFRVAGANGGEPPFKTLHIRVRNQIVADGLSTPLNWQQAGYDMPPLEWHRKLKHTDDDKHKKPLILDCRNSYETDVGRFDGAEPLQTDNFRDTWNVLEQRLEDVPKDAEIMTYCTGGIRCVKVNAYLTQKLNFTNVSRLAGGIVAYDRTLSQTSPNETPLFKGTNYVFDGRVGRHITNDALGDCITCGRKTNLLSNCRNVACHKRMVQCEDCREEFWGSCSDGCRRRVLKKGRMDGMLKDGAKSTKQVYRNLEEYSVAHSSSPPSFYREMESTTAKFMPTGSHMISGPIQGRLLKQLASMTRTGRVLELGTFTGYATACFLEGVADAAEMMEYEGVGSREDGPFVLSLERDLRSLDVAASHLNVMQTFGVGEEAAEKLKEMADEGRLVQTAEEKSTFIYNNIATCELLHVTDALATIEEMASYQNPTAAPFDLVFIDADKTRLLEYVDVCLSNDLILKQGGWIVVDNTLWKGLVLEAASGQEVLEEDMDDTELKKSRRARRLAGIMHRFNEMVVEDDRLEVVVLPMRDGLSIIRKK